MNLALSQLPKMWIIDIDGTIFIHNAYLEGEDVLVPNFLQFYQQIDKNDYILLISARKTKYKSQTIHALKRHNIRYNEIIFNAPKGERILINDTKPHGLQTAIAINTKRNFFEKITLEFDNR